MSIEWLRDLAVCILGFGVTIVAIFIAVLALMQYLELKPILKSLRATTKSMEDISSSMENMIIKPIAKVAVCVQVARQAFDLVNKVFRRKKGEQND